MLHFVLFKQPKRFRFFNKTPCNVLPYIASNSVKGVPSFADASSTKTDAGQNILKQAELKIDVSQAKTKMSYQQIKLN